MISFTRYINITSGVIGGNQIRDRELILRLFTSNALMPSNTFAEFTSAADVGAFFGTSSSIYKRAVVYFSFLSKLITQPTKISIASWVQTAVPAKLYGAPASTASLATLQAITAGSIALTLGTVTHTLTAINLGTAASLADVAAAVQTAVRTQTDPEWVTATVAYDVSGQRFVLTGGVAAPTLVVPVSVAPVTGATDLGAALGWQGVGVIASFGSPAMSLTDTLTGSNGASNNFGTFAFDPTLNQAQITEVATWNATQNNMFVYCVPVTPANAAAISAALMSLPGVGMTLSPDVTAFPELMPAMIEAATDYLSRNSSQNYMYQQANFAPTVSDDNTANTYDALRVNYFGQTQQGGQVVSFYQRGVLTGLPTSPTDMNIYANEQWFKSDVGAGLMSLLLSLPQISTNATGRAQIICTIQASIVKALFNGTISVGKTLNVTQQAAITNMAGDPNAWRQVQNIGYWLDVEFQSNVTEDGRTEWAAVYTLIYAKNDAIRSVVGTHALV